MKMKKNCKNSRSFKVGKDVGQDAWWNVDFIPILIQNFELNFKNARSESWKIPFCELLIFLIQTIIWATVSFEHPDHDVQSPFLQFPAW